MKSKAFLESMEKFDLPDCYRELNALVPGRHDLHVFPGYGHQDVFMGKRSDVEIFPRFLTFLEKHRR